MTEYTIEDYRAAAQRAKEAGNIPAAKELARRGMALQANPAGTGVGRAAQRGYYGTLAGGNQFIANIQADKIRNYTVDEDESFKRALNIQLKRDVDAPLDKNLQGKSQEEILDHYSVLLGKGDQWRNRVTQSLAASRAKQDAYRQSGLLEDDQKALAERVAKISQNIKKVESLPYSPTAKEGLKLFQEAEGVKEWAASSFKNPLASLAFIGEVAAESIPSLAAGAGVSLISGNPIAGAGVMVMASAPREYGGEFGSFLSENGVDMTNPESILNAMRDASLMEKAHARGITKASIVSAFEALGMGVGGGVLKQTVAQSATGGGGEAASQLAIEGEISSPKDVALEAVAELATVPGEMVIRSGSLFKKDGSFNPDTAEGDAAAASVAQRLRRISQNNGYNLKDVKRGGGAMNALENTRNEIVSEIEMLQSTLKSQLTPDKNTELKELLDVYAQSKAGLKQSKNKVANKVTKENFEAIKALVAGTKEGDLLLQKLQESNVVTDLFQNGLKGGVSQYTDYFNPLSSSGSVYDPGRGANIATSVLTGGGLFALGGPTALAVQGAGVAGGRAIDAVTGRRSRVSRFERANAENQPFVEPTTPSIRDIEAQTEMESAEARRAEQQDIASVKDELGSYDLDSSPVGTMLLGTGLDRDGLRTTLEELKDATDGTYVAQMAQSAIDNINGGENKILDLSELIAITNSFLRKEGLQDRRVAKPDSLLAQRELLSPQTSAGPEEGAAPSASSPNYEKGILANQAVAARLKNDMLADPDINGRDKALLEVSLENVTKPLGRTPVDAIDYIAQSLIDDGVDPVAIETYIKPYRDRVEMQQLAAPGPKEAGPELSFEEAMRTVPQDAPAQPSLAEALRETPTDDLSSEPILPVSQSARPLGLVTQVPMENTLNRSFEVASNQVFAKGRDLKVALQQRSLKSQKDEKIDLTQLTDEASDQLADFVVNDALEALVDNANAIGWYDKTMTDTLDTMSEVYPEIRTSQPNRLQFIWALAVTSNGLKVDKNLELAGQVYEVLQDTGRFPTDAGIGEAANAINEGLARYHSLLDQFGGDHQALEDFMNSQQTVKALEQQYGVKITGEGKGELVRGAAVLGPKIGNGFFSNLYGNFDALTMDRWLMRTVGRWRGTLIKRNPAMERQKRDELFQTISGLPEENFKALKALLPGVRMSQKNMSDKTLDALANAIQKNSMDKNWRAAVNMVSEDTRKIGNGLSKYLDGQVEQPAGTKERAFIRGFFNKALQRLNETPEVRQNSNQVLTMSDLQALLWYPEKRLYDTSKQPIGSESRGYADEEAPDYANAARKFVNARSGLLSQAGAQNNPALQGQGNRLGSAGPDGRRGGGPSPANAGPADEFATTGNAPVLSQAQLSPPAKSSVTDQAAPVRALFEIGKPGGEFENGIQDLNTAAELSAALGQTVSLYSNHEEMMRAAGYEEQLDNNVRGLFRSYGTGSEGHVFGLLPGAQLPNGAKIESLDALITFLHELSHGIGKAPFDGSAENTSVALMSNNNWEAVINGVLHDKNDKTKAKVRDEIIDLQENREVSTILKPNITRPVRMMRQKMNERNTIRQNMINTGMPEQAINQVMQDIDQQHIHPYREYYQQRSEFAVDPLWVYLINPKLAKKIMPETTKLIAENFAKAKNPKLQFYAHPLGIAVAAMMAIMFAAGEEDEQPQMVA